MSISHKVEKSKSVIIISASSDIGVALCNHCLNKGWQVSGTYRTESEQTCKLKRDGVNLIPCDVSKPASIRDICQVFKKFCPPWDILIFCTGTQEPVGLFIDCDFQEWKKSVEINFLSQMQILHELLPSRNVRETNSPLVLFFAGAGTNNAPPNYSAYIISKIALIKMCELLDTEIPDTRFVIVGPGWVKTKIHNATIKAGSRAGDNYKRTIEKLANGDCTSMDKVLEFCDWAINSPRELVSGRNFSLVYDPWKSDRLKEKLLNTSDMYKLRRAGNGWKIS